jgi:Protein of unknown function (DUF2442)
MAITDAAIKAGEARMRRMQKANGTVHSARYDRRLRRIVLELDSGLELSFSPGQAQGLGEASPAELSVIEVSPSGLGLHWPRLDADLYLPALLKGLFGSKAWMAKQMGEAGGKSRSGPKSAAARENGKRGGRPRKKETA